MSLIIDLNAMLEDTGAFSGELPGSVFDLPEHDTAQAASPLSYDLLARKGIEELTITGSVSADFLLECGRCLTKFPHKIVIENYYLDIPLENQSLIDLTEELREDILLLLPNFPRCEESNLEPRVCPAQGRFPTFEEEEPVKDEVNHSTDKVWDALDTLKPSN